MLGISTWQHTQISRFRDLRLFNSEASYVQLQ